MDEIGALTEAIRAKSLEREEGCRLYPCLSLSDISQLSDDYGLSTRQVSIYGLERGFLPLRYVKNVGTVGLDGQATLLASRVLLVGTGGLGGTAAELLARMGIGALVIMDPDTFDETNLNRQNFACSGALGQPKVDVVAERLLEINCDVEVIRHRMAASADNLPGLIAGVDIVIDALDTIDDRLMLQRACREAGKVMVHGAIAGTSLQVTTVYPGEKGLAELLPETSDAGKARGIEVETGNPATTPVLTAVLQVQEAVKVLLGKGDTLRGRMLYMDIDSWTFEFIEL
jgi:molybdopterin/thiamine biosynthesis adenylyltransferase